MKLTTRGFTLVELMIVIAIIGVLAAALFPAISGYLSRSRDTARVSHVGQIMTAASALFLDKGSYDLVMSGTTNACVSNAALGIYMGWSTPVDKNKTHCGVANSYGAGTWLTRGSYSVVFSAVMENQGNGNTGWVLSSFQSGSQNMDNYGLFQKNYGIGYIMAR